jgi:hypothetical protein
MTEIEVQNKINFRNIGILFLIGVAGCFNGMRDFYIYQVGIAKVIFPDPVVFQKVVVLNQSMMSTVNNSMSFIHLGGLVGVIVIVIFIIAICAGTMGMMGGMAD